MLRQLSHPGVARLISSFRFRDGAYLVLEYAEGGDLHTMVTTNGSLDEDSARFVCGEVVAVLASIHEVGFVYGDLKPENVLLTEAGHVKIGDFGGCRWGRARSQSDEMTKMCPLMLFLTPSTQYTSRRRAYSAERRRALDGQIDEVSSLRNGDWRDEEKAGDDEDDGERKDSPEEGDERVEGTAAYLPPEVIRGERPSYSSDVWSWGCLLFFCLAGKPPLIDLDHELTMKRVIAFANDEADFYGRDRDNFSDRCRSLISLCCHKDAAQRPSLEVIANDGFFESDVFSLYKKEAPELNVGKVKVGQVDANWQRRQHSMIWSPQAAKYEFDSDGVGKGGEQGTAAELEKVIQTPIEELVGGEEKEGVDDDIDIEGDKEIATIQEEGNKL